MTWEIAITVAAIGLLALFHLGFAPSPVAPMAEAPPPGRDDAAWGRWLALAAIAAAGIAFAALIIPTVFSGR